MMTETEFYFLFFSFLVDLQISNNHSSLSSDSEAESNLKTCVPHHFTSSSSSSSCRATYLSSSFHIWRQSLRFFFSLPSSFKSLLSSSRSFSMSKCESQVSSVFPAILSFSLSLISPFTVSPLSQSPPVLSITVSQLTKPFFFAFLCFPLCPLIAPLLSQSFTLLQSATFFLRRLG